MRVYGLRLASTALATMLTVAVAGSYTPANALSLWIAGGNQNKPTGFAGYGIGQDQNNVVNAAGGNVVDTQAGVPAGNYGPYYTDTPYLTVIGSGGNSWTIEWYYVGSESGHAIEFSAANSTFPPGAGIPHTENDANNNHTGVAQTGPLFLGSSTGTGDGAVDFQFVDTNNGVTVSNADTANGGSNPNNVTNVIGLPSLIMAYLNNTGSNGLGPTWEVISSWNGEWVLIGLNDNGSSDDNHDDYMLIAHLLGGGNQEDVPIPASLPLMGSALAAGYLVLRRRRKLAAAA